MARKRRTKGKFLRVAMTSALFVFLLFEYNVYIHFSFTAEWKSAISRNDDTAIPEYPPVATTTIKPSHGEHLKNLTIVPAYVPTTTITKEPSSTVLSDILNRTIMYVHVGKTGGTTLDKVLRSNCEWYTVHDKMEDCLKNFMKQKNESVISLLTKSTLHWTPRQSYNQWINSTTTFLVTLRNPVSRAVSGFNFEHPRNDPVRRQTNFYDTCFPTVENLAQLLRMFPLMAKNNAAIIPENMKQCYEMGKNALIGIGGPNAHLKSNYAYYSELTTSKFPEREVLVIRTEHLWEDLKDIDKALGGTGYFVHEEYVQTHGSEFYEVATRLSPEGVRAFCCYLANEIQVYEDLLQQAANLVPSEKEKTLIGLYNQCGVNAKGALAKDRFSWEGWATSACSI